MGGQSCYLFVTSLACHMFQNFRVSLSLVCHDFKKLDCHLCHCHIVSLTQSVTGVTVTSVTVTCHTCDKTVTSLSRPVCHCLCIFLRISVSRDRQRKFSWVKVIFSAAIRVAKNPANKNKIETNSIIVLLIWHRIISDTFSWDIFIEFLEFWNFEMAQSWENFRIYIQCWPSICHGITFPANLY